MLEPHNEIASASRIIEKIIKWFSRKSDNRIRWKGQRKPSIFFFYYIIQSKHNENYYLSVRVHTRMKKKMKSLETQRTVQFIFMLIFLLYLNGCVVIFLHPQWLLILGFKIDRSKVT